MMRLHQCHVLTILILTIAVFFFLMSAPVASWQRARVFGFSGGQRAWLRSTYSQIFLCTFARCGP